jgi:hypothetical protein
LTIHKLLNERLLARGKVKKVAIAACMRKLSHILWGVVKNGKEFDPAYASDIFHGIYTKTA